jgi:hypothetical protein
MREEDVAQEKEIVESQECRVRQLEGGYWVTETGLPGLDFCRQIVPPGTEPSFPQGCVAVRVDDDFWCVAALPYQQYRDRGIREIVAELWPDYAEQGATYAPDSGTTEQRIYQLEQQVEAQRAESEWLQDKLRKVHDELRRHQRGPTGVATRSPTRLEMEKNYFVRQYEVLLRATAHAGQARPEPELAGVCRHCGLLLSDRVHSAKWIELRAAGAPHGMDWAGHYPDS